MRISRLLLPLFCCGFVSALAGCGGDDVDTVYTGEPTAVALEFQGAVGSADFDCARAYGGIGTTGSTIEPLDFRFYVTAVRLLTANGGEYEVELDDDGVWQNGQVALVDFEDGSGTCANGTPATNTVVRGTAPKLRYTGVRFELGVPAALNHEDASAAASPLNLTALFWSWNAGYKFLRADSRTEGLPAFNIHLGSTGCQTADRITTCTRSNRPVIELDGFDPESSVISADLAALLAGSNVDQNQAETAPGCMSGPTDAECAPIFSRLGLALDSGDPAPGQTFFRVD